jgi:peroxiredoxin
MPKLNHLAALAVTLALASSAFAANPPPINQNPAADPAASGAPAKVSPPPASPATPAAAPRPGFPAPGFSLPDAAGKTHSLASYLGKWVVLEWVNYDCPFVKKHYGSGNMQKTQKMARGKGVVWLSVNSSAPGKQGHFAGTELTRRIVDSKADVDGYLLDPDGVVGKLYKAKTTPHMFVIDPQGKVVYAGAIDDKPSADKADIAGAKNLVQAALESGMAGKPVAAASTAPYGCGIKYAD